MTREQAEKEIRDKFTEVQANEIIKALEQESVINKIRAEIEKYIDKEKLSFGGQFDSGLNLALKIINKYKEESEAVKDSDKV